MFVSKVKEWRSWVSLGMFSYPKQQKTHRINIVHISLLTPLLTISVIIWCSCVLYCSQIMVRWGYMTFVSTVLNNSSCQLVSLPPSHLTVLVSWLSNRMTLEKIWSLQRHCDTKYTCKYVKLATFIVYVDYIY